MRFPESEENGDASIAYQVVHQAFLVAGRILDYDEGVVLYHSWRVAFLSEQIGCALGIEDPTSLFIAGLLHDIGAVRLTDHIVHQASLATVTPGAMSHVVEGARIIESIPMAADLAPLIAAHHERVDGRGYPAGARGADIPVEASVIHLADILDVSLRNRDPLQRLAQARTIIREASGTAVFPRVCEAASSLLRDDPTLLDRVFEPSLLARSMRQPDRRLAGSQRWSPVELTTILAWTLGRLADAKHQTMIGHSLRVGYYATRIARNLPGIDVSFWEILWAALLHDLGMSSIPKSLVGRAGPLSGSETAQITSHTKVTGELVGWIHPIAHLAAAASSHHEHYDGTGYPEGRAGEQIPLVARILAYADTFDALTSNRPYRLALPRDRAIEELQRLAGNQLDPQLVKPAVEALRSSGHIDGSSPQTATDYMALCETGHFELMRPGKNGSGSRLRPVGNPVVLLPSEKWTTLRIDEKGGILDAPRNLTKVLGFHPEEDSVQTWFDDQGRTWVVSALQDHGAQAATSYLYTRKNRPVEVTLVKSKHDRFFLIRSAESRIDATSKLAVFYRSFLQSTHPTVFLDREGRIRETNRSFLNLTSLTIKEALGSKPEDILLSDEARPFWNAVNRSLRNPNLGSWSGQITMETETGQVPIHLIAMAVRDAAGVDLGYLVTIEDRREQVAQEKRMSLLNEALLSLGGDYEQNMTILVSTLAKALDADRASFYHRQEKGFTLRATYPKDRLDPESRDATWCASALKRAHSDLLRIAPEVAETSSADHRFRSRICYVIRSAGSPDGLLCADFDERRWLSSLESHFFGTLAGALTRQVQLEATHDELRRREAQYRLVTEHAGDIIWSLDADGVLFYVNRAVEDILGVSQSGIIGRRLWQMVPEGFIEQACHALLENPGSLSVAADGIEQRRHLWTRLWNSIGKRSKHGPVHLEIPIVDRQGQKRYLDVTARSVPGPDGGMHLHGIARDVTRRKQHELNLENRAHQAEEMSRMKSELIASTSHDLKSPVNAILSYLNLMEDEIDDMDRREIQRYLRRMRDASNRLLRLISDVMDLEKIEAGVYGCHPDIVDLVPLANSLVSLHEASAAERDISILVATSQTSMEVQTDEQGIERVLTNLLSNAIKYSPRGGKVTLSIARPTGHLARISIEDEGPGIPPKDIERVFDRFYQAAAPLSPVMSGPSSGLGLAIVRKLVELNRGRVWAESAPSGGARFVVELPTNHGVSLPRQALIAAGTKLTVDLRTMLENNGVSVRTIPPAAPLADILARTQPLILFVDPRVALVPDPETLSNLLFSGCLLVIVNNGPLRTDLDALQLSDPILEEEVVQLVRRARLGESVP